MCRSVCRSVSLASLHLFAEDKLFFGHAIDFFFVLSSYLITSILFAAKEKNTSLGIPKSELLRVFLLRRTIRIFPAYYTFLVVVMVLPTIGRYVRDNAGMFFSYLVNYRIFTGHAWPPVTAHIWTLAVEEQFYLLWPLVIFFVPQRYLLHLFIAIIVGSVVAKALCYYPAPVVPQNILTQYCLEPFSLGGLLAYKARLTDEEWRVIKRYFNLFLLAILPVGIAIIAAKSFYFSFVLNGLVFSMVSLKIIEGAAIGYKNVVGKFLQNSVVIYIGRISYGIYLYHLLIPVVFWKMYDVIYVYVMTHYPSFFTIHQKSIDGFGKAISSETACFIIYAGLTTMVAIISAKFIELPLSRLKVSYTDTNSVPTEKQRGISSPQQ